jgi:hypothetical protein
MPDLHVRPLDADAEPLAIEMAVRKGAHLPAYLETFRGILRQSLSRTDS